VFLAPVRVVVGPRLGHVTAEVTGIANIENTVSALNVVLNNPLVAVLVTTDLTDVVQFSSLGWPY